MKSPVLLILLLSIMTSASAQLLNTEIKDKIPALEERWNEIPNEHKETLEEMAAEIIQLNKELEYVPLTFVCTHNSRRSQLSQVWLMMAAEYYGIEFLKSYSGGTEATAFNIRMVNALQRYGLDLRSSNSEESNPRYGVNYLGSDQMLFSKKYDDDYNPQKDFIAVMVCSSADRACPFVSGAAARFSLPFIDPKKSDDSPQEAATYDAKVEEIGIEILYLVSLLKKG
jgi:protein-tyrosine-phosphatase